MGNQAREYFEIWNEENPRGSTSEIDDIMNFAQAYSDYVIQEKTKHLESLKVEKHGNTVLNSDWVFIDKAIEILKQK